MDILAVIDHNITVNVVKDGEIVEKKDLVMPKEIRNVFKCKNPRCITSIEQGLPHVFVLADEARYLSAESHAVTVLLCSFSPDLLFLMQSHYHIRSRVRNLGPDPHSRTIVIRERSYFNKTVNNPYIPIIILRKRIK